MIFYLITILLCILYSALIVAYYYGWFKLPAFKINEQNLKTNISVIISARNEAKHIRRCIESLTEQDYDKNLYEVIIVDDHSSDETPAIIASYSDQNIKLIKLADHITDPINSYKKKAIEIAIERSSGYLIVTTDADCIASGKWLSTISAFYEKYKPAFIAAPVAYYRENSFLKIFQSTDFMMMQGITASAVNQKFHTMCNGANMAYEKKAFYEVNGFKGIDNIASGDDMLLMHKIYKAYPDRVLFLKNTDAIMLTNPVETISEFMNQRIRWASKSASYTDRKITVVLALVYVFNAWIFLMAVISIFYPALLAWLASVLLFKIITELIFLLPVASFFRKKKLLWWFVPAQPFHVVYILIAGWLGKFGTYNWKDRKVK